MDDLLNDCSVTKLMKLILFNDLKKTKLAIQERNVKKTVEH